MRCKKCNKVMDIKKEKKTDGAIGYTEYYFKCGKCGVEGTDTVTARKTALSWKLARNRKRET